MTSPPDRTAERNLVALCKVPGQVPQAPMFHKSAAPSGGMELMEDGRPPCTAVDAAWERYLGPPPHASATSATSHDISGLKVSFVSDVTGSGEANPGVCPKCLGGGDPGCYCGGTGRLPSRVAR